MEGQSTVEKIAPPVTMSVHITTCTNMVVTQLATRQPELTLHRFQYVILIILFVRSYCYGVRL